MGCKSGVWVFGDGVGPMFGSDRWSWFYFLFLGCDRCLKGLWVVVGSGVWVMVMDRRAGMKWVVGRGSGAEVRGWSLVVVGLWLRRLR